LAIFLRRRAGAQRRQHLVLNLDREHAGDLGRDAEREIAGPGAEIGHGLAAFEVERRHDFVRLFLGLALGPVEPGKSRPHPSPARSRGPNRICRSRPGRGFARVS